MALSIPFLSLLFLLLLHPPFSALRICFPFRYPFLIYTYPPPYSLQLQFCSVLLVCRLHPCCFITGIVLLPALRALRL